MPYSGQLKRKLLCPDKPSMDKMEEENEKYLSYSIIDPYIALIEAEKNLQLGLFFDFVLVLSLLILLIIVINQ